MLHIVFSFYDQFGEDTDAAEEEAAMFIILLANEVIYVIVLYR